MDAAQLSLFPADEGAAPQAVPKAQEVPPVAPEPGQPIRVDTATTLRWTCRERDLIVWCHWDPFSGSEGMLKGVDFWCLRDGDRVLITNEVASLPPWFRLHPLEATGRVVWWMMEQLKAGYQEPPKPVEGPNLWRVPAGDRLAWVRPDPRGGEVLAVVDVRADVLVAGEPGASTADLREWLGFGAPPADAPPDTHAAYRTGFEALRALGPSRVMSEKWGFGG